MNVSSAGEAQNHGKQQQPKKVHRDERNKTGDLSQSSKPKKNECAVAGEAEICLSTIGVGVMDVFVCRIHA